MGEWVGRLGAVKVGDVSRASLLFHLAGYLVLSAGQAYHAATGDGVWLHAYGLVLTLFGTLFYILALHASGGSAPVERVLFYMVSNVILVIFAISVTSTVDPSKVGAGVDIAVAFSSVPFIWVLATYLKCHQRK